VGNVLINLPFNRNLCQNCYCMFCRWQFVGWNTSWSPVNVQCFLSIWRTEAWRTITAL